MDNYDTFSLDFGLNTLDKSTTAIDVVYDEHLNLFGDIDFEQDLFGVDFLDSLSSTGDAFRPANHGSSHSSTLNSDYPSTTISPDQTIDATYQILAEDKEAFTNRQIYSPTATDLVAAVSPEQDRQRKRNNETAQNIDWRDSMIVFSSATGKKAKQRKRKRFSPSRKEQVTLQRKIGSCIQCKLRKASCNLGMPCECCLKRTGIVTLSQQICSRRNLLATRFDHIGQVFAPRLIVAFGKLIVALKELPIIGKPRYLCFSLISYDGNNSNREYIQLPIVTFNIKQDKGNMRLCSWDYWGITREELVPDPPCAIEASSLPSVDQLLELRSNRIVSSSSGPFQNLQHTIGKFAMVYCTIPTKLPLQHLLQSTLRLQKLQGLYINGFTMRDSPDSPTSQFVSSKIRLQISAIISKEISELEMEILSEMDKLLFSNRGIGRCNSIGVWFCMWTLIFTYKEHLLMMACWAHESRPKYDLCFHMYNTLTSIYSALYKTTSPLTLDWRTEEVSEMLGKDKKLINYFSVIKTEMYWIQSEMHCFRPEDNLFRRLVVENENRLLEALKKVARKQGILRGDV
ncbi:hypothetical protein BGZ60DRAFT_554837 [Tricladium varicosporioides]|nr:hypothetical protein BGZ60DRAFT_554837 [Hymenoscyphus varicosporioides]